MDKITPCLWFDGDAERALELYGRVFGATVVDTQFHDDAGPGTAQTLFTARFEIHGRQYMILNAGPGFPHSEAFSLSVDCEDQEEVDRYWDALIADGGEESRCGWLKDPFGISWQIVPRALPRLLEQKDREAAARVMQSMMGMTRIVVAELEAASAGAVTR